MTEEVSSANGSKARSAMTGKIVWGVMIASLMANAFLVGTIGGRGFGRDHDFALHAKEPRDQLQAIGGDVAFSARPLMPFLSPETRRLVIKEIIAEKHAVKQQAEEVLASRQAILELLKADPLDEEALKAALQRANTADAAIRESGMALMVRIVPKIPRDERVLAAEQFEAQLQQRILRFPIPFRTPFPPPGGRLEGMPPAPVPGLGDGIIRFRFKDRGPMDETEPTPGKMDEMLDDIEPAEPPAP